MQDGFEEVVPNLGVGFATFLSVHEDYHIVEGRLGPKSHTRVRKYAPALYPELPGELAKLQWGDVDAVLKFARVYGTLGYRAFIPLEVWVRGGTIPIGDPLLWIWAHADTVKICLELSYLLQEGDAASLRSYLQSLRITDQDIEERCDASFKETLRATPAFERWWEHENNWPSAVVATRGAITLMRWGGPALKLRTNDEVNALTRQIRRSLINENIAGIHRVLLDDGRKDGLFWEFGALIEMVYWHVANAVDGRQFKRCEADNCGALFVQTDPRQHFCPPMFGRKGESRCAVRHRVHKHRSR